jgi:hypothetical protein
MKKAAYPQPMPLNPDSYFVFLSSFFKPRYWPFARWTLMVATVMFVTVLADLSERRRN